jgi:succinate dehydrogenase hydrophobic anchor subunit
MEEGLFGLLIIYCLTAVVLFIVGIIQIIIKSSRNEPVKSGLKLLIISVIMVVIGFGACAVLLASS